MYCNEYSDKRDYLGLNPDFEIIYRSLPVSPILCFEMLQVL